MCQAAICYWRCVVYTYAASDIVLLYSHVFKHVFFYEHMPSTFGTFTVKATVLGLCVCVSIYLYAV